MVAIKTNGLTKEFGDFRALSDLDLTVEEGEVFGFLGPNGAGKTTTIDLLLDFTRPTSGTATVLGYDTQTDIDEVRDRIGILPDGFDLWSRSTGYQHLEFAIASKGDGEDPDELLARVGLDPADAERKVGGYSKGMLQRLAMAMALVGDPDLLIMDEPSTGLDPNGIQTMQNLVTEVAESGTTVFFSSHILSQVSTVCDRVGILEDGELVTVDTIDGLRKRAGIGSRLDMEVTGPTDADLQTIDGVTGVSYDDGRLTVTYTVERAKAEVIHRVVESGTTVFDFETHEVTLEDLFASFTETDPQSVDRADVSATDTDESATDTDESATDTDEPTTSDTVARTGGAK